MTTAHGDELPQGDYVFSLSPRPQPEEGDDWDRYSENIRPTRRGRRIEALHREEEVTEEEAKSRLEDLLQKAADDEDPLASALNFCSWFENHFTIGHHRVYYELLWKIVNQDGFVKRYEEDERMLKLWDKLADNSGGHGHDIYQYAISHKSLIRCAFLYVRWSQAVELASAFVEARRVFLLAKTNRAVPLEAINEAEDAMEMRAMRRHIDERSSDDDDDEETRVAFTRLPTMGDAQAAPVVRLPSMVGELQSLRVAQPQSAKHVASSSNCDIQPFEIFDHGNADDEHYLMNVHELNTHIERYAIRDGGNACINDRPVATKGSSKIQPVPSTSAYEVWCVDKENQDETKGGAPRRCPRMVIKKDFKSMSFEEYMAENVAHLYQRVAARLSFDDED